MKRVFNTDLSTCRQGQTIYGFYHCSDKIEKCSKNGDMYLDVLLSDQASSLYAKVWNHVDYFNSKFKTGVDVAVKGKVVKYRNRFEINILNINTSSKTLYSKYGFKK